MPKICIMVSETEKNRLTSSACSRVISGVKKRKTTAKRKTAKRKKR